MSKRDLSLVFDGYGEHLKVFNSLGEILHTFDARGYTTASPGEDLFFGHFGKTPPGRYGVGHPQKCQCDEISFGPWFIPFDGQESMKYGRGGLAIHGGGSGLLNPFSPRQGWVITHGCIRLQNEDLEKLAELIIRCQEKGGIVSLLVVWQK